MILQRGVTKNNSSSSRRRKRRQGNADLGNLHTPNKTWFKKRMDKKTTKSRVGENVKKMYKESNIWFILR